MGWFGKLPCAARLGVPIMSRMERLPFARKGQTSLVSDMDGKMSSWLIASLATFSSYSFGLLMIGCLVFWMPMTSSVLSLRQLSRDFLSKRIILAPVLWPVMSYSLMERLPSNSECSNAWLFGKSIALGAVGLWTICLFWQILTPRSSWYAFIHNSKIFTPLRGDSVS